MHQRSTSTAIGTTLLAAVLLCGGGCHIYQSVTVNVRDAETGAPVDGGAVRTSHVPTEFYPTPWSVRRSVVNGQAKVQVVDGHGAHVHVTAPGYNPVTEMVLSWSRVGGHLPPVDAAMYREPAPSVVIELPDGYTGPVRVVLHLYEQHENAYPPGQRVFPVRAGESEVLALPATQLVWRMPPESFEATYPDGRALPTVIGAPHRARPAEVALRRVRDYALFDPLTGQSHGRGKYAHIFFVGTGPALAAAAGQLRNERIDVAGRLVRDPPAWRAGAAAAAPAGPWYTRPR